MVAVIVSASRRTDVPAFFGGWFMKRLQEGYVMVRNPLNRSHVRRVELTPDQVDCIVFWTKNPTPFLRYLPELDAMGYTYYFQYTLNPYPKQIEGGLPAQRDRISAFQVLADHVGPNRVVWRYDPIILTDSLTIAWHLAQFAELARELKDYTRRCVISFVDTYQKTRHNTKHLGMRLISVEDMHALGRGMGGTARSCGLEVTACCEAVDLQQYGITRASCIDANLVAEITGAALQIPRDRHQRSGCSCAASIDIGAYNTCLHQCTYCYANTSARAVQENLGRHRLTSAFLID